MLNKKGIIVGLIAAAAVLLLANVLFDALKQNAKPEIIEFSRGKIDSLFNKTLDKFGIENSWRIKTAVKNNKFDSLKFIYQIKIPAEITIPVILSDLASDFKLPGLKLDISEIHFYGKTGIMFFSNGILKLQAFLNPSPNAKRNGAEYSFLIAGAENLDEEDLSALDRLQIHLSLLYFPSLENDEKISLLEKYNYLNYSILIDDRIEDAKYMLDESLGKSGIKGSVYTIVTSYAEAEKFYYDTNAALCKKFGFTFIKNIFKKNKVTLLPLNKLNDYTNLAENDLFSFMKFLHESKRGAPPEIIIISFDNIIKLKDKIAEYKKMGDKFVPLSSIYEK